MHSLKEDTATITRRSFILLAGIAAMGLAASGCSLGATSAIKSAEVGSTVTFGSYEQDGNETNGVEPIEWIVLDKQDGKALLLSKYALDCRVYDPTWFTDVTWSNSKIRTWLNGEFVKKAFSKDELGAIVSASLTNSDNPNRGTEGGPDTTDQIFLLSYDEVQTYLSSETDCICLATENAIKNGVVVNDSKACSWWLRSPGNTTTSAMVVDALGNVWVDGRAVDRDTYNQSEGDTGVRPAIWVNV